MSSAQDDEFSELVKDLNIEASTQVIDGGVLDLKTLGEQVLSDLASFKKTRLDMIAKREALKKAIKIMDKRIEITLAAIKTLQTPA